MQVTFDPDDLRPLIQQVVAETLDQRADHDAAMGGRLAFSEVEAAALLGLRPHVLRDLRLSGRVVAVKAGRSYRYSRVSLLAFLAADDGSVGGGHAGGGGGRAGR
jgi:hypothetical protein